jgi:hypothetical protein
LVTYCLWNIHAELVKARFEVFNIDDWLQLCLSASAILHGHKEFKEVALALGEHLLDFFLALQGQPSAETGLTVEDATCFELESRVHRR